MRVVFTGTQRGMSDDQHRAVDRWLHRHKAEVSWYYHGGCIGADAQFHQLLHKHGELWKVTVEPSDIPAKMATLVGSGFAILKPWPPLKRNRHMVKVTDVLIATPFEQEEVLRSGTWATIRYARKAGHIEYIFY